MNDTVLAILLGLCSAVTLAAANYSVKAGSDILASRAILQGSASVLMLPVVLFLVPAPTPALWGALAITVPVHFLYQLALIGALKHGDLSLVFPIMRGGAPMLTGISAFLLLGERLSGLEMMGLAVATGAVILFALPPRGVRLAAHPDRRALGLALLTASGIALYNVTDARGVRLAGNPFSFIAWLFLFDCVGILALTLVRRRGQLMEAVRLRWRYGVAGGVLSVLSYGAALYAFTLMETAKVSALRETSVLFGALLGAVLLKEGLGPRRIMAALVLVAGLALMQLG
ncbi:MAG: DMT family transporter [Novosphingopyxis baekryungensis]|jgi:drug/metabolite transporter (DMT)-like permease|nr:DMT family transporter [Novosphingopyxis baekryungensis]